MPGVRIPPRRLWPKLKWSTRRVVAPEEVGSSPTGHPIPQPMALREIWDQRGPIRLVRGFDSRSRDQWAGGASGSAAPLQGEGCGFDSRAVHPVDRAGVAQLEEARRSDRRQCRFESDRQYEAPPGRGATAAHRPRTPGAGGSSPPVQTTSTKAMRGSGRGTTPGSEPGGPRSNRGLAALDASAAVRSLTLESACCADRGSFVPRRWR